MADPAEAPLVSVIIPCYRQGHLLSQAIDSVLAQTYRPIEIVVVNDGSDDDTDAVARGYGTRIVYVSKPNGGLSSARNAGIARATGEYLLFLDSDDLLHPEAIRDLSTAIGNRPNTLAITGYRRFTADPALDSDPPVSPPQISGLLPEVLRRCCPVHTHLVPSGLVKAIGGFDEQARANEDLDFWLRLGLLEPAVVTVPSVGAYYRRTPGAMTQDRERINRTAAQVLFKFVAHIRDNRAALGRYGGELLNLIYALRRRFVARGTSDDLVRQLSDTVLVLHKAGARVGRPFGHRLYDSLPGWLQRRTDRAVLTALKVFRPHTYRGILDRNPDVLP